MKQQNQCEQLNLAKLATATFLCLMNSLGVTVVNQDLGWLGRLK
jgi:hypothetical protein